MKTSVKVILLVCAVPVVLFFGSAILAGSLEAERKSAKVEVVAPVMKLGKGQAYERYAFANAVTGKFSNEVLYLLGKPEKTQSSGNSKYWYYSGVTWDQTANRLDSSIQIVLDDLDRVKSVNFY